MATLNIYLANIHKLALDWTGIAAETKKLFQPSIDLKSKDMFDAVEVTTVTTAPALLPEDLLVYVVRFHEQSVLGKRFTNVSHGPDQYGYGVWEGNEHGAEVYVRDLKFSSDMVAKFVWHECLHVKAREGEAMHNRAGLASKVIDEYTTLTTKNVSAMQSKLKKQRPMWTGGFYVPAGDDMADLGF